ncbi:hypothetical protein GJ744_000130 [Endocarpon pusillum]|uniref:Uncharacterized protein n=1 Tax=Endocarpon pusillum TaxID=364733 RepID=A0A8H7EAA0_9EURO|nr:hypothetical protein GJ744_000130 [Endocarpon pusillum]
MEDDYRRLQPVKLDIIGTETGRERYFEDGWFLAPSIANWRNNLTACSQRHNLYFIAHRESVAVFQPTFPSHKLGRQPQINIVPALAKANARGILDASRPHSINHLIVGELGSEEILFLSTDSGNVAAYYTASIQEGIEKEPYRFNPEGRSDLVGIRPFFTHWVYESAWGLSIHKHARMLAVSSNKPYFETAIGVDAAITVFAFALTSSDASSSPLSSDAITPPREDDSDWRFWIPEATNPTKLPDRSVNWKTRLEGHPCNIPSISFVNSDDDRVGNYLLSTDIQGITKCWHIWQRSVLSTWDFSAVGSSSNPYLNSQQTLSGWTVLALDPSSFQVVDTQEELCGAAAEYDNSSGCFNITQSLHRVPGHDRSFAAGSAVSPTTSDDSISDSDLIGILDDDNASSDYYDEEEEEDIFQDIIAGGISFHIEASNSIGPGSMDPDSQSNTDEYSHGEDDGSTETESESEDGMVSGSLMRIDSQLSQVNPDGAEKVKMHHSGMLPAFQPPLHKPKSPMIPTLHLSASHLRLFDASNPGEALIYCSEPLSFQWPMYHATRPEIDRLNLMQYIPELGIVVIGTQIGRVAVCTLTKKGTKGSFCLRVDWILPFESQEKSRERPLTHLVGIAVGPVQGHHISRPSSVCGDGDDGDDGDDMEDSWLRDRIDEDGVSTTFDPEVIRIRRDSSSSTSTIDDLRNSNNNHIRPSRTETRQTAAAAKANKRRRSPPLDWRSVKQAWPSRSETTEANPIKDESWRGIDYSRRHRLMLTYYDQTVMTYELSRGRPFVGDPVLARPNWRNREGYV